MGMTRRRNSKRRWLRWTAIVCGLFALALATHAHADSFDLAADWSDASNPNGPWTYRESANPLPFAGDISLLLGSPVFQPAWAPSTTPGSFLPSWFRSTSDQPAGLDFLTGDVVVHTDDEDNGLLGGPANVIWTSSGAGRIDITGSVWMTRDIGRGNDWVITLNDIPLTDGQIFSGDAFDGDQPFDFADGSGGPAILQDLIVAPGDEIRLQIVKTEPFSIFGDLVGVNLHIEMGPIPEPGTLLCLAVGIAVCGRRERHRSR